MKKIRLIANIVFLSTVVLGIISARLERSDMFLYSIGLIAVVISFIITMVFSVRFVINKLQR